eukprot:6675995-Prymnesium_polylepis.1
MHARRPGMELGCAFSPNGPEERSRPSLVLCVQAAEELRLGLPSPFTKLTPHSAPRPRKHVTARRSASVQQRGHTSAAPTPVTAAAPTGYPHPLVTAAAPTGCPRPSVTAAAPTACPRAHR